MLFPFEANKNTIIYFGKGDCGFLAVDFWASNARGWLVSFGFQNVSFV
jgi:hypothetical protein